MRRDRQRRVQSGDLGLATPVPQPTARPRDTFLPFTGNRSSGSLRQLAQSLSTVSSGVGRFATQLDERGRVADTAEGLNALRETAQEQSDIRDAVNAGELHPSESPHFKAAFQGEAGKVAALQFRDTFVTENSELLSTGTELEDFDAAAQEALKAFREGIDSDQATEAFDIGFNATQSAAFQRMRAAFANGAADRSIEASFGILSSDVFGSVFSDLQDGVSLGAIAEGITDLLDERFDTLDLTPALVARARDTAAQAIGEVAGELNNLEVLELFDLIKVGPAGDGDRPRLLFSTQDIKEKFRDDISGDIERNTSIELRAQDRDRTERLEENSRNTVAAILAATDRSAVDLTEMMNEALAIDPTGAAAGRLQSIQNVLAGQQVQTDTLLFNSLAADIWTQPLGTVTPSDITTAMGGGRLDISAADFLMRQIDKRNESGESGSSISDLVRNPLFTNERGNLARRFGVIAGLPADPERPAIAEALLTIRYLDFAETERGQQIIGSGASFQEWLSAQSRAIVAELEGSTSSSQIGEQLENGITQGGENSLNFDTDEVVSFTALSRILLEAKAATEPWSIGTLKQFQSLGIDPNDTQQLAELLRGQKQVHGVVE